MTDLGPATGNPRNSEGAFLPLKDGRVAFLYSRYRGTSADDHAYAEIAAIFWDGRSFTEPKILVRPEAGTDETNCMSVSAVRTLDGNAAVFYLVKHEGVWSEYIMRRSSDEFHTVGDAARCVSPLYKNYYVINNDRVIRLSDGRLFTAAAVHPSSMKYHGQPDHIDGRSSVAFYESCDDGATWNQTSGLLPLPGGAHSLTGLQEPGVVELPNGALYAYFRTDLGRHYESFSVDGGSTWTVPQPSEFTGPASPLLVKKNPFSGKYYAVWNPVPETPCRYLHQPAPKIWTGGRTPLVIAESDDGIHFGDPEVIEDNPMAGFCYPSMCFTGEDSMLLAYCAGGVDPSDASCLVRTRITNVNLGNSCHENHVS